MENPVQTVTRDPAQGQRWAALFDMDRTLVSEHTARLFTRFRQDRREQGRLHSLRVAYWLFLYTVGLIDAPSVARVALADFEGMAEKSMVELCREWFPKYVLPHVSDTARAAVRRHRERGDVVAIVTGAARYGADLLARELGIEHVVCSQLVVGPDGTFTGEISEPLCLGPGKVQRTTEFLTAQGLSLSRATFYSDSMTDRPLFELVREPVAVNPDFRLRRLARRRGWPILAW